MGLTIIKIKKTETVASSSEFCYWFIILKGISVNSSFQQVEVNGFFGFSLPLPKGYWSAKSLGKISKVE